MILLNEGRQMFLLFQQGTRREQVKIKIKIKIKIILKEFNHLSLTIYTTKNENVG